MTSGPTILVFPVPSERTLTIELDIDPDQPVVKVMNNAGQRISDFKILSMENDKFILDINRLPVGIYFGSIESAEHSLRFRFVRG